MYKTLSSLLKNREKQIRQSNINLYYAQDPSKVFIFKENHQFIAIDQSYINEFKKQWSIIHSKSILYTMIEESFNNQFYPLLDPKDISSLYSQIIFIVDPKQHPYYSIEKLNFLTILPPKIYICLLEYTDVQYHQCTCCISQFLQGWEKLFTKPRWLLYSGNNDTVYFSFDTLILHYRTGKLKIQWIEVEPFRSLIRNFITLLEQYLNIT